MTTLDRSKHQGDNRDLIGSGKELVSAQHVPSTEQEHPDLKLKPSGHHPKVRVVRCAMDRSTWPVQQTWGTCFLHPRRAFFRLKRKNSRVP